MASVRNQEGEQDPRTMCRACGQIVSPPTECVVSSHCASEREEEGLG